MVQEPEQRRLYHMLYVFEPVQQDFQEKKIMLKVCTVELSKFQIFWLPMDMGYV